MHQIETVKNLMAATFGIERDRIGPQTEQLDIVEWDSVGHLNLMLSLEQTFGVTLDVEQMTQLTSVPAILQYLEAACRSQ